MEFVSFTALIVALGVAFAVLLVLRGVSLWYFRINDSIKEQQLQNSILEEMLKEMKKQNSSK